MCRILDENNDAPSTNVCGSSVVASGSGDFIILAIDEPSTEQRNINLRTSEDVSSPDISNNTSASDETSWYLTEVPKGPWSLQINNLKKKFTENSLRSLSFNPLKPGNNYHRGYTLFKCMKVKSLLITNKKKQEFVFIKSNVESSYKLNSNHKCFIKIESKTGEVKKSYCKCKSGVGGKCSHIFAVLWCILDHINSNKDFINIVERSCTEKSQSWGLGSKKRGLPIKRFEDLQFVKHRASKQSKNLERVAARKAKKDLINPKLTPKMLENYSNKINNADQKQSFCYVLKKADFQCNVDRTISSTQNTIVTSQNKKRTNHLKIPVKGLWGKEFKKILGDKTLKYKKLSLKKCRTIQIQSKNQGSNKVWKKYKKIVITSTKFHSIINRKKKVNDKFINYAFGKTCEIKDHFGYLQKGLENEKFACKKYKKLKPGYKVFSCGLCINPGVPIIGTSPDRIVKTPENIYGLLEIKTLCKAIDKNIPLHEAVKNKVGANAQNLEYNNGFMYLKRNSSHFYQMQGQMALCGLPWCDYFVDGGNEFFVERIKFDENFWLEVMLPKLVMFYYNYNPF